MTNIIRLILLPILLIACFNKEQNEINNNHIYARENQQDTTIYIHYGEVNFIDPVAFSDPTLIYEERDTSSKVIRELEKFSPVSVIDLPENEDGIWYKIVSGKDSGYVKTHDIASHSFRRKTADQDYIYYIKYTNYDKNLHFIDGGLAVYKKDIKTNQFVDTLIIDHANRGRKTIQTIDIQNWKNIDILIDVNSTFLYTEYRIYIADANNRLFTLFKTDAFADESGEEYSSFVSFKKDTLIHERFERKTRLDENNEPIMIDEHEYGLIDSLTTEVYLWDGNKLVQVK